MKTHRFALYWSGGQKSDGLKSRGHRAGSFRGLQGRIHSLLFPASRGTHSPQLVGPPFRLLGQQCSIFQPSSLPLASASWSRLFSDSDLAASVLCGDDIGPPRSPVIISVSGSLTQDHTVLWPFATYGHIHRFCALRYGLPWRRVSIIFGLPYTLNTLGAQRTD